MTHWLIEYQSEEASSALRALPFLLEAGVNPIDVLWLDAAEAQSDLWATEAATQRIELSRLPDTHGGHLPWPRAFLTLAQSVVQHAAPHRFQQLHRMAIALAQDPQQWQDRLNPLHLSLERMAREVKREIHKMHAFVRFRPVNDVDGMHHMAWFEPLHHIVRSAAPFFVDRFAAMRWSILTPRLCVRWDRRALTFSAGADRSQAPAPDDGEARWVAYYRSIFNPSRLKTRAMLREMPRRYWDNLPEAQTIAELIQQAPERSSRMIQQTSESLRRRPAPRPNPQRASDEPEKP
jgi:DNA polymerase